MTQKWVAKKDPSDISWWEVDLETFLDGDTLAAATWTVPSGITKVAESNTTTLARVKLSGGTAGTTYTLTLDLTTAGGQSVKLAR